MSRAELPTAIMVERRNEPSLPARPPVAEPWAEAEVGPTELARRAAAGCEESFVLLVQSFGARVFNYLYRLTRHHQDAQDLTQETFLKAYRALRRQQHPVSFQAWILTIARRTALNHFRSAKTAEELRPDHSIEADDPGTLAAEKDERRSLWSLARTLKPRHHEVLWLHYAEGLSIEEIARVMSLGRIHVRVLLHRARAELARRLTHHPGHMPRPTPNRPEPRSCP
jgi:RNA polymerase sigma-70 factor, ECF subfamily